MSNAEPEVAIPRRRRNSPAAANAPTLWGQWKFVILAVGLLLVFGSMIVGAFALLRQTQTAQKEVEAIKARLNGNLGTTPGSNSASAPIGSREGSSHYAVPQETERQGQEASIVDRARLLSFQSRLQAAVDCMRQIRDGNDLCEIEFKDLLSNEQGRQIASDREAVRTFITLLEMEHPTLAMTVAMQERVDNLRTPVEAALSNDSQTILTPKDDLLRELDQLVTDSTAIKSSVQLRLRLIQDLMFKFAKATPSPKTLGEAVQESRLEASEQKFAELNAAREAAQREADSLVIAAERDAIATRGKAAAEAERMLGEAEAKEVLEVARLRKEQIDAELAQKTEEQRVTELQKRAKDPFVQRKYTAFLDKGLATFSYGPGNSSPGDRPLPASWSQLNRNGFLKDVESFAKSMSAQVFHTGHNDRRVSAMPKAEVEWKEADRLYEDFKQLGPIWVEMGLLLP